jgi:hypothetical protein
MSGPGDEVSSGTGAAKRRIGDSLAARGVTVTGIERIEPSLEDVFLRLVEG